MTQCRVQCALCRVHCVLCSVPQRLINLLHSKAAKYIIFCLVPRLIGYIISNGSRVLRHSGIHQIHLREAMREELTNCNNFFFIKTDGSKLYINQLQAPQSVFGLILSLSFFLSLMAFQLLRWEKIGLQIASYIIICHWQTI